MLLAAIVFAWVGMQWLQAAAGDARATPARSEISLSLPPYASVARRDSRQTSAGRTAPSPALALANRSRTSGDDNEVREVWVLNQEPANSLRLVHSAVSADSDDAAAGAVLEPAPAETDSESEPQGHSVALVRTPVVVTDAERAERAYSRALRRLHVGDARAAEQDLREALTINPGYLPARELLLVRLMAERRWAQAVEVVASGLELAPGNARLLMFHARILSEQDKLADALVVLAAGSPPMDESPDYYGLQAALLQRSGAHRQAVELYRRLVAERPGAGIWWMGMGISLEALGRTAHAREAYRKATRAGPLAPSSRRFVSERLLGLGT
jgi:MSHA biogenesis protein MshN